MVFLVMSSFCGFELSTAGLMIGYTQFFLSGIVLNAVYSPEFFIDLKTGSSLGTGLLCIICAVNMIMAIPFILGILVNPPSYMRPNIIWGKGIFVLSLILCLWFGLWDVVFVIGMVTNTIPRTWAINNIIISVHVAWILCLAVTVMSFYLVSLMKSLYDSMTEAAQHDVESQPQTNIENAPDVPHITHDEPQVDDVTAADKQDTLLTFKIYREIKSNTAFIGVYIQNSLNSVEKYFDKFQEYVTRKISDFVELPAEKTDTQTNVQSNNDSNAKTDTTTTETKTTNQNVSCSINVDVDKEKTIISSDATQTEPYGLSILQ